MGFRFLHFFPNLDLIERKSPLRRLYMTRQKPVILRASDEDARRTSITHPPKLTHAIPRPPPKNPTTLGTL